MPQATAPEFQPAQHNTNTSSQSNLTEIDTDQNQMIVNVITQSHPSNNGSTLNTVSEIKKGEFKSIPQSAITLMNYSPGYSTIENGTTVYPTANGASFPTYQQGVNDFDLIYLYF